MLVSKVVTICANFVLAASAVCKNRAQQRFTRTRGEGHVNPNSPFKDTMLLLQGVRRDRLDLMNEVYGPWFGKVSFIVWGRQEAGLSAAQIDDVITEDGGRMPDELADEIASPAEIALLQETPNRQVTFCEDRPYYHGRCLAPLLEQIKREKQFTGVLTMHMDFWIDPTRLMKGSSLSEAWQLHGGLLFHGGLNQSSPPLCTRDTNEKLYNELADNWMWWNDAAIRGQAALLDLKDALIRNSSLLSRPLHSSVVDDLQTCAGWSDLFYLPTSTLQDFATLSRIYGKVYHEAAVPTVMSHLESMKLVSISPKRCGGSCCVSSDMSDEIHACGHRFDFAEPENRDRWKQWMNERINSQRS